MSLTEPEQRDKLPNPKRGCGHLGRGKAYLRGTLSGGGVLPSFVKCDPPIPFREIGTQGQFTRSYIEMDGLTMQLATEGDVCEYVPLAPNYGYEEELVYEKMVETGVYATQMEIPSSEVDRHMDRIQYRGAEGRHWGDIPTAGASDLLMRAGESYYPEPEDFIEECRQHGLSKAIPISKNKCPTVVPGITRCWVMHPAAAPESQYGGGVIGYAYLNEVVFTEPEDGEIPKYVNDLKQAGNLRIADIEEPEEVPEAGGDDNQLSVTDFDVPDEITNGEETEAVKIDNPAVLDIMSPAGAAHENKGVLFKCDLCGAERWSEWGNSNQKSAKNHPEECPEYEVEE